MSDLDTQEQDLKTPISLKTNNTDHQPLLRDQNDNTAKKQRNPSGSNGSSSLSHSYSYGLNAEQISVRVSDDGMHAKPPPSHQPARSRPLIASYIDHYFEISKRGSTIMTEIRGGTVGFLTLAYIVLLNPQVLAVSGIPYKFAASSTCLASCVATLICGVLGNIPVGCGPGVGLSAYFSYGMMPGIVHHAYVPEHPYLAGLFMAFLSGAIVFVLTLPGFVTWIVGFLPQFLKIATIVGMGLFLAFVGMVDVGLVVPAKDAGGSILELGDLTSWIIWLSLLNCVLIATLEYFKITGSLLMCIAIVSILYFVISQAWPTQIVSLPAMQDPLRIFDVDMIAHLPLRTTIEAIVSFVLIAFLDVSGVTYAIASICGLNGRQETLSAFQKSAFIGTSIGTMVAAMFGCSPIIVCIETSSGAAAGARTGLSAVVIAIYFFLAMFLGPVIGDVPAAATSPVLVFIGTLMMGEVGRIQWSNMRVAIPAFFCIVMMPFTYSISNGLFFGVFAFFLTWLSTGQFLVKWKLCGVTQALDERFGYGPVATNMSRVASAPSRHSNDSGVHGEREEQRR